MDKYEEVLREIPRVREDLGFPPLVTPLSQMVGTQAVMNIIAGERYKMVPKEINDYLKGLYGQAPAPVNEDVRKKIIGDAVVITHRPADDIAPEFDAMKAKYGDICESDEDVLSCALFENVAVKFLENRKNKANTKVEDNEVVSFNVYIGGD
jgi:oxaloacetate decarboxylase alpha subunit